MNGTKIEDTKPRVANGQAGDQTADATIADEAPHATRRRSVSNLAGDLRAALRKEADAAQGILWLPVAMALGAACWFGLSSNPPVAVIALPFVLLIAWLVAFDHGRSALAITLASGFLAGMLAADVETRLCATILLDGELTTRLSGKVVDRDVDHAGRWRYTVDVDKTSDPEIGRPPRRVRLVARARHEPIETGSGIAGLARLQPPSGPVLPGEFDFSFNAYFQGISANGFFYGVPEVAAISGDNANPSFLHKRRQELVQLREGISSRIRAVLPGEAGSLASALTVAERRSIHPDLVEALRASGLAHILAISGLHMVLVAGTFFFFVRACFSMFPSVVQAVPVKKIAALGALLVAAVYLVISGASVSTQRAFIMLAIVLVAVLLDRRALTMRNVALAAIIIILTTPSAVVGPGFQMSFAATAALIVTYELWDRRWSERVATDGKPVAGWISAVLVFFTGLAVTSLVAGLATAPFAIFHFHRVATYGLLANLAAMPIVTLVVMPAGLFSLLAMPVGLEHWPLVAMGKGLDAVIAIARYVEGLGGAVVVGRIDFILLGSMVSGFLIFVLLRTRLRMTGVAIMESVRPAPPFRGWKRKLRCLGSVTPRHELVQFGDLVICDLSKDPCEPSLRIDAVELGGFDQGEGDCYGFAAALRTGKHPILTAKGNRHHGSLGGIVIEFQKSVFQIGPQTLHPCQGITDSLGQRRLAGYFGQLRMQPCFQIIKDRLGFPLANGDPFLRRTATCLFLDAVELCDPQDRLLGYSRALRLLNINELAPDMGHAGNLAGSVLAE
ncbi:MAG: ComEC family competence protein [Hyphomicrobiales bacterium]|nr:ComEC family competence protein [Hyphomicrobiales bacterium]